MSTDPKTPGNKLRRAKSLLPLPQREVVVRESAPRRTAPAKTNPSASAASGKTGASTNEEDLQKRIAEKAYELFQLRGYNHGLDKYDWELADKIVRLEQEQSGARKRFEIDLEDEETKQLIAQKAYELYEMKGCAQGTQEYDWHIARELVKFGNK